MTEESLRLRSLFEQRTTLSQGQFGKAYRIGAASMVWQYLSGRRRLGLVAAGRFARGLGVELEQISPRLANELRELTGGDLAVGVSGAPEFDTNRCKWLIRIGQPFGIATTAG